MPNNAQIKLAEDQFVARLRENLKALPGTDMQQTDDRLRELRQGTHGKLLRQELEATFPLGRAVTVQVTPKRRAWFAKSMSPVTLTGQVLVDLSQCIESGGQDPPAVLTQLHERLQRESEQRGRLGNEALLGLFSPTGWDDAACQFARNDPPGSGWASGTVSVILIGPGVTDVVWDVEDLRAQQYVECFCGLTRTERQNVCREKIERALLVQEFANLEDLARDQGFSFPFVKDLAQGVASGANNLALKNVSGVGWVIKKKI